MQYIIILATIVLLTQTVFADEVQAVSGGGGIEDSGFGRWVFLVHGTTV